MELHLPMEVILLMNAVITLIFLILVISLWVKLNKVRKKYKAMLNGSGATNVEDILIDMQNKWENLQDKSNQAETEIRSIHQEMGRMKSNVGIYRYNAFADGGSDLSFSIAVVDEERNGVVISGIHSREQTFVYAKPVEHGQSQYTLSPEEKEAINRSLLKE